MNLTMHTKHLGHGHHFFHAFRHDCDMLFHSTTFWAMIAFFALAGIIITMAMFFGGGTATDEFLPNTYPNIYWP